MRKIQFIAIIFIYCFFYSPIYADVECRGVKSTSKYFPSTLKLSQEIAKKYCEKTIVSDHKLLFNSWHKTILEESRLLIKIGINVAPHFEKLVANLDPLDKSTWASFNASRNVISPNGGYSFFINNTNLSHGSFDNVVNEKCNSIPKYKVDCYTVLKDLSKTVNIYKKPLVASQINNALNGLRRNELEWEEYFTKARAQTPWELALNSSLYKSKTASPTFVLPPQHQVIAFHPNLLMEYLDGADEGSQLKTALALEWVGINFWNKKIPIGASLMSTYSDRSGASDVGHGVLIHINNKYSVGITDNDGNTGISFSVDLYKIFQSKEKLYTTYKDYIKK